MRSGRSRPPTERPGPPRSPGRPPRRSRPITLIRGTTRGWAGRGWRWRARPTAVTRWTWCPRSRPMGRRSCWCGGEDDTFQEVRYAERFAAEVPNTTLVRVPGAGHIPMENDPAGVTRALAEFFLG
ncbi:alpha/beta hydrolase [Nonomuraea sp. NPDC052116]|uniref:alpha/beta fold hydrolase n=1 Tax=Nonomuraea sp. NPDC052116 TaxID=3155665 RepID=UPI003437BBD7